MSTLWTPDGERPVADAATEQATGRDPDMDAAIAALLPEGVDVASLSDEQRAQAEQLVHEMSEARSRLLATPAATIVANHAMGLYELAALHLSAPEPDFAAATLAIDALDALVSGLEGRLGDDEATLRQALTQVRLAYVQVRRAHGHDDTGTGDTGTGDTGGDA